MAVESISRGRAVQLRIALSPEHNSSRGMVEFAREISFRRTSATKGMNRGTWRFDKRAS